MVITDEFKFPRPPIRDTGESPLRLREISGIDPLLPINHHPNRWRKEKNRPYLEEVEENLTDQAEKDLQLLIDRVNRNLEESHVAIHLGLVKLEKRYALDIYDCTGGQVCLLVKDDAVHISDLPKLLKNLQEQAGILIDLKA
ncbi:MAG: hypothetical protein KQH63_06800 [Desulfobulbaceae bacterium]|nr:hypothetical protein [Desulfobulbaceae bacterium]